MFDHAGDFEKTESAAIVFRRNGDTDQSGLSELGPKLRIKPRPLRSF